MDKRSVAGGMTSLGESGLPLLAQGGGGMTPLEGGLPLLPGEANQQPRKPLPVSL